MKPPTTYVVAAGASLAVLAGGLAAFSLQNAGAASQPTPTPAISDAVFEQMAQTSELEVAPFNASAPSIVNSRTTSTNENTSTASTIGEDKAISAAQDSLGLGISVKGASLVAITTNAMGIPDETTGAIKPEYAGTAVWAVQFGGLKIRRSGPLVLDANGKPIQHPATYTADMVAFIDAYTGEFLYADQYDPPTSGDPGS